MVKSASRSVTEDRPYSTAPFTGPGWQYKAYVESLEGDYGRKKQNACYHYKTIVASPGFVRWELPNGNRTTINVDASNYGSGLYDMISHVLDPVEYAMLNTVARQVDPIDTSFSILNFLYELREVPSLLDPFKMVAKRVSPSRAGGKRLGRNHRKFAKDAINDISSTYVNANFGYVPTISDGFEITSRLSNLENSYADLKKKLKPRFFRRKAAVNLNPISIPCPWSSNQSVGITSPDDQATAKLVFKKCQLTATGRASYDAPEFNTLGFITSVLDRSGFYFDLATLWNVVPFSWAVDWVFPIGDALAADRKSWTQIDVKVEGTYTWKIEYEIYFPDPKQVRWTNSLPTSSQSGKIIGTLYLRSGIPPIEGYKSPPNPGTLFPKWNVKKGLISAAVANGFKRR